MDNLLQKARALAKFLKSRVFAVGMLSVVLAFVVFKITSMTNAIYVTDGETSSINFTMEQNSQNIINKFGIGTLSAEQINFSGISGHYGEVDISNLVEVTVTVDETTATYQVENGTTVGELLYEKGVFYDGNDLLTPKSEKPLQQGDEIVLQRVEYERYEQEQVIPYETVHKNSSLIRVGATRVLQEGDDGTKVLTYVRRTVDGVQEETQLLGEKITKHPTKEIILIGSVAPVSGLDFDLDVDENGKPLQYKSLLTNQVATGYSARSGAKTASGRFAITGHVAVDPREIPYGSKLYIVSSDNKFVYGCAIAADTGTGLLADIVDVDLFYDTYEESRLNGRKSVDIYILE